MLLDLLSGKERAPAECVIEVDSRPIVELYPFLIEATVETSRTEAATATLVFETRRDEIGEWTVQDAFGLDPREPILAEWKPITIRAAFGVREEEVLRGFIRQVHADYPEDAGAARVTVECQDESMQLDREHVRKAWGTEQVPLTDRLILSELLAAYSPLAPDPQGAAGQDGLVGINQDGTDIQFLKARAEANGYELLFRRGSVYFGPMRLTGTPQPTLMVYAGADTNCLSLKVTSDSHQPDAVQYQAPAATGTAGTSEPVRPDLPVLGQSRATSDARGLRPFTWTLSGEAGANETRLRALAQRKANDFDIHKVQGEGELDGTLYGHVLLAGQVVGVDGLGSRLSGQYYVDTVSHSFNAQGYRQRFKLLRNAYGDNLAGGASLVGSVLSAVV
ncbi:phage late control D family protein [Variovorax saccharolyticus]|uniref:phage late control D family protein n=1 Tax=Variovorax saccharolyticus TaxID=3053516 RepID=UPI0025780AED|nr:hypothetical protein [Variovorax sp. J31P216]MDM0030044.1 hypothetical protein [Variovorax sp. J31P216]